MMQIFAMMQQVFELWTNIAGTYPRRIKVRFFFYVFSKEVIELCCDSTMKAMDVSTSQPLIKIAL